MVADDSILRRLPSAIEPKQALFLDGIRHAVDIIELAYGRLRESLTRLALEPPTSAMLPKVGPHVFLDAWAMIDAIDRFRQLYKQMPGIRFSEPEPGVQTLDEILQPCRDLRNVADHLAQKADRVVKYGGAALGTLSWVTGFELEPPALWYCRLQPGIVRKEPQLTKELVLHIRDWPTDQISLAAGGYQANLSEVRPHIDRRVEHLEAQLLMKCEKAGIGAGAVDVFVRQPFRPAPGQGAKGEG